MGIVPINERKTLYIKIVESPVGGYRGTTKNGIISNAQTSTDTSVNGYIFVTEDGTEIKSPTINSMSVSGGENSVNVTLDVDYKNGATENKYYYSIYNDANSKWSSYTEGNIENNVCTFDVSPHKNYTIKAYVVDSRGVSSETFEITGKASNEIPKPEIKILKPDSEEEFEENDPATFEYKGDIWYPYGTRIKIIYPENMTNLSGTYTRKYTFGSYTDTNNWGANAGDNNIITATQTATYFARITDQAGEVVEADPITVHIMPRDINGFYNQPDYEMYCAGQIFPVIATGTTSGTLYGTDKYAYHSCIGKAAMHMGLVNNGETYRGYIKLLTKDYYFKSSQRNGITSDGNMNWNHSYIFVNEDGTPIKAEGEITSNQPDENNIDITFSNSVAYTDKYGNNWYPYGTKLTITYSGEGKKSYYGTVGTNNDYTSTNPVEFTLEKRGGQSIIARITDTATNTIIHEKTMTFCVMPNPTGSDSVGTLGFTVYPVLLQGINDSESTEVYAGGTNSYGLSSNKQKAAIHLGILKSGESNKIAFIKYSSRRIGGTKKTSYTENIYGIQRNGIYVNPTSVYCSSKDGWGYYSGTLSYFDFVDEDGNYIAPYDDENNVTLSEYKVINPVSGAHSFINNGTSIVPTNMNDDVANLTATAYIDLDLTNYNPSDIIKITLNANINFTANHYGSVKIYSLNDDGNDNTNYGNIIARNTTTGEIISNGTIEDENTYTKRVSGGQKYRIKFEYTNKTNDSEYGTMIINSLAIKKVENDITIVAVDDDGNTISPSFTDKYGKEWYPYNTKFKIVKESGDTVYYRCYYNDGENRLGLNEFSGQTCTLTLTFDRIYTIKFGYTKELKNDDYELLASEFTLNIMPYLNGYNYGHFDSANIGKIYPVKVERGTYINSRIYGTEKYSESSNISMAATHMGLLDDEEEKYLYIKAVSSPEGGYKSATKNGITSSAEKDNIQNGFVFVTEDGTEILEPIINSETTTIGEENTIVVTVDAIGKNDATVEKYYYSIDNGEYIEETNNTYTFTVENSNSIHTIKIYVRDSNGAISQTKEILTSTTNGAPTFTLTDSEGNPVLEENIVHYNNVDWYPYGTKITINYAEDMTNLKGYFAYIDERTGGKTNWSNTTNKTYTTQLYYSVTYRAKLYNTITNKETEEVRKTVYIMPSVDNPRYYAEYLGNIYPVRVTGTTLGTIYGTDTYYMYLSNISKAATHMGLVKEGETKTVFIKIVKAPTGGYIGSTRNGITTNTIAEMDYNGFMFVDENGNEITRPKVDTLSVSSGDNEITVTANASSNNGEIKEYYYSIDNGDYVETTDNHYTFKNIIKSGEHSIKVYVKDSNGDESAVKEIIGRKNIPTPTFNFNQEPIIYNGEKWYPYGTIITIKYNDEPDYMDNLYGYYRTINVHTKAMSSWNRTDYYISSTTLTESMIYEAYAYETNIGEGEHIREKINIMANPNTLQANYRQYAVGDIFPVQVTGTTSGTLYGTDTYRYDSNISKAATHAGLVEVDETKLVYIKIVPSPEEGYNGSTQNGIASGTSSSGYVGYKFIK